MGIGGCLSRGTLISMFLVMFVLPQILLLGDTIVEKTSFRVNMPEAKHRTSGTIYVNGRVRGRISGIVDAKHPRGNPRRRFRAYGNRVLPGSAAIRGGERP